MTWGAIRALIGILMLLVPVVALLIYFAAVGEWAPLIAVGVLVYLATAVVLAASS